VTPLERFAAEDVMEVLRAHGIETAHRATTIDPTEEVVLLEPSDFDRVDEIELARSLMGVLPHRKVWVAPLSPAWESEPIEPDTRS
jgi:hypothetical protein